MRTTPERLIKKRRTEGTELLISSVRSAPSHYIVPIFHCYNFSISKFDNFKKAIIKERFSEHATEAKALVRLLYIF